MKLTDDALRAIATRPAEADAGPWEWIAARLRCAQIPGVTDAELDTELTHLGFCRAAMPVLARDLLEARQEAARLREALNDALDAWDWMVGPTRPTSSTRVNEQIARARATREPR